MVRAFCSALCLMAVLAARPATAADMWSGFYFGPNFGYATGSIGNSQFQPGDPLMQTFFFQSPQSTDLSGPFAGFQVGYNWTLNSYWLVGIEADLQGSAVNGSFRQSILTRFSEVLLAHGSQNIDYFGTLRARFGWLPTDNLLIYVTGGYAFGKVTLSGGVDNPSSNSIDHDNGQFTFHCDPYQINCFSGSATNKLSGVALGGGFEIALSPTVKIKFEYLRIDFGSSPMTATASQPGWYGDTLSLIRTEFDHILNIFRWGINVQL